jgi:sugar transferase (PEP-CTERM/EpsH1 system associated)
MKILWISHLIPYPPKTGVLQRSYHLLKEASNIGEIHLVALNKKGVLPIPYDLPQVKKELLKLCKSVEILNIPAESSRLRPFLKIIESVPRKKPFSVTFYQNNQLRLLIEKLQKEIHFDIAHFDTISLAEYLDSLSRFPKTILNHHNIESDLFANRIKVERNPLKNFFYRIEARKLHQYEKQYCSKFDVNFTVSQLDKQILENIIPGLKIAVVPNGVDTQYFLRKNRKTLQNSLVIVSGMNWYPNRDAVIHMCNSIWPLLCRDFQDLRLTVVGAQPPKEVIALAQKDNRVKVTGFVDDVRPFIESADLYLCPMRDGGGTRLKILDAMAMGKAIISTSKGCEGIEVTPEKNILIADTPVEFVAQIKKALTDTDLKINLEDEARKLAEAKYSWRLIGNTLDAIYNDLLS